jgi:hypothetical protein
MKMEYTAEIIRGWPYDGSLDRNETIKSSVTLTNGDWVAKQSDGTVDKSGASASAFVGLVIQGNGDSGSAVNSNKAVVLWGNFIAKISNYDTGASYAPGSPLTAKSGKLTLATGTDPIVGHVLDVVTVSATNTAHLVVKVA